MIKKRMRTAAGLLAVMLTGMLTLTGCQSGDELETDDITISQYKGVEIEAVDDYEEATDDDVTAYIDEQRVAAAVYEEITDRAAEEGDTVNIDYVGYIDGEELENGSEEGYDLVIGSDTFIDGFEDSIIGHTAGETFDWDGKFPDDYAAEEVAGKDVVFTITVNSISVEQVPELDDDFARSMSDTAETAEDYEEEIRAYLTERNEVYYQLEVADDAWSVVMNNTEVKEYPSGSVQEMQDLINEEYETYAQIYGTDMDTFVTAYMGYDSREAYDEAVEQAAKDSVKQQLAVDAIADKENLTMTDEIYDEMLDQIVLYYGYGDVETLTESADEESLQDMAKQFQVKEWVGDHCVQVEGY